jgi:hypothetical protein
MNQKEIQALDLMIEDLHKKHTDIRFLAKEMECESELEDIKNYIINHLIEKRDEK